MSDRIPLRKIAGVVALKPQLRLVPVLRVPDADEFAFAVQVEIQNLCNQLLAIGWRYIDIETALDAGHTSLSAWRSGERDVLAKKLFHLRAIVAREVRRAA